MMREHTIQFSGVNRFNRMKITQNKGNASNESKNKNAQ